MHVCVVLLSSVRIHDDVCWSHVTVMATHHLSQIVIGNRVHYYVMAAVYSSHVCGHMKCVCNCVVLLCSIITRMLFAGAM